MTGLWLVLLKGLIMSTALYAQGAAQGQFCATYNDEASPEDCSFTSMEMCQQSISGIGGYCAPAGLAPAMPPPPLFRRDPFALSPAPPPAFAPAAVPPPPIDPAAAPLPLPDGPGNGY
jgi:hypothetical protein